MTRLLPLLLVGCASSLPPSAVPLSSAEQQDLGRAVSLWRAAGLPWTDTCQRELPRIRVQVEKGAELARLCKGTVDGACMIWRDDGGFWLTPDTRPVLVLAAGAPRRVWQHEVIHLLAFCSGLRGDLGHQDGRLWGDGVLGKWRRDD